MSSAGQWGGKTLQEILVEMKAANKGSQQGWMAWKYDDVVNATTLVDWLVSKEYIKDRDTAVKCCLELQAQGAIHHVWDSNPKFRDQRMFFYYSDGGDAAKEVADAYDVVVIGAGTAGLSASSFCGSFGVKCVVLEQNKIGGDCTWTGCVPSKTLIKASHVMNNATQAHRRFSPDIPAPVTDMKKVKDFVYSKIHYIAKHDEKILEDNGVPLRYCKASFTDPNNLQVKTKQGEVQNIRAKSFILCLGAVAAPPPLKGLADVPYHSYETIFDVEVLPKRLLVVGGGVIGCELAQAFARFGSEVTLVSNRLLRKESKRVDELLRQQFEVDGIKLVTGRADAVEKVDAEGKVVKLFVKSKTGEVTGLEADVMLIATGRRPNTAGLNLEGAGVELTEKTRLIKVNENLQTTAEHIFAAGDCCTLQQFTHYASQMGIWAARNLLLPGSNTPTTFIPRCTFTEPEVAAVGCTEEEARVKNYEIFRQDSLKNERAVCEGDARGFIEVYLDSKQNVMGATIMNQRAGELLSEILVCMSHKLPFTKLGLRETLHAYPTYSWGTMMLATDVDSVKFRSTSAGKLVQWYVGRG